MRPKARAEPETLIADKLIGAHRSMLVGGVTITLGHLVLAVSGIGQLAHNTMGMSLFVGGLVLIAEDRSEQLALSAVRDTLLRTRTATFDSKVEEIPCVCSVGPCR